MRISLKPYDSSSLPIQIFGEVIEKEQALEIVFELSGKLDEIRDLTNIEWNGHSQRTDALWEKTCFEVFIQGRGATDYREVNFGAAGQWNIFFLDDYRKGKREACDTEILSGLGRFRTPENYRLTSRIAHPFANVRVGLTAVLQRKDNDYEYWATSHHGPAADFHLNESWEFL